MLLPSNSFPCLTLQIASHKICSRPVLRNWRQLNPLDAAFLKMQKIEQILQDERFDIYPVNQMNKNTYWY